MAGTDVTSLAAAIHAYFEEHPSAVVLEDGAILFDMALARYSLSTEHNKCVLHLWSEERNLVRRVLGCEQKAGALRLSVQRMGQAKPQVLEICGERDRRTPTAKRAARVAYQHIVERSLTRHFPDHRMQKLTFAPDLEHSFGPAQLRGLLRHGQSAMAVVGVCAAEPQTVADSSLTTALLWLERCRAVEARVHVEGCMLLLPPMATATVRARMAQLDLRAAKFQLFELDEQAETLSECDFADAGNLNTRLVRLPDREAVLQRFAAAVARIREMVPEAEALVRSPSEVAFRYNGLEFARAQLGLRGSSFAQQQEIVFGAGANETVLTSENEAQFAALMQQVRETRRAGAGARNALWRMHPERWLEAEVMRDITLLDPRLDAQCVYSQVPAFAAADRAMIDLLTCTRDGRLAVVELKAEEDLHLPLQGLDYWTRVRWHHRRGEFQQQGYFAGRQLSPEPPLLFLVAPALRVHPATDALLRYISPAIEWTLVGLDEGWRESVRVVFRKSSPAVKRLRATPS